MNIRINEHDAAVTENTTLGDLASIHKPGADVLILNGGNMMLATVNAGDTIFEVALGSKVWFNGPQTAGSVWEYHGPNASTKLLPDAVITAGGAVVLEALHFQGVNAAGLPYVDSTEKPAAQIVSNFVGATLYGSMNAPIAGNTNWMLNQMQIAPFSNVVPHGFSGQASKGNAAEGAAILDALAADVEVADAGVADGGEDAAEAGAGQEPAGDARDHLVERGIGLDREEIRHADRADPRDPPDVVAQEIDDHQIFGQILG